MPAESDEEEGDDDSGMPTIVEIDEENFSEA